MYMNYKVIDVSKNEFHVYETKTDQVIMKFNNKTEAREHCKHFNLGGGFDGLTPNFFLKTCKKW